MISTFWGERCRLVPVRTARDRSYRRRRVRICTVGNDGDTDGDTEGEAEGEAEALDGGVVHVTQGDVRIVPRGQPPR